MILFNFLLAIICDAFGEVKANASESVSVNTELGPMLVDSWRSTFRSFYRSHVPEDRVRRQLKIWKGENPDDDSDDDANDEGVEKVLRYDDSKELDMAGLKRVLHRCVIETFQRSAESKNMCARVCACVRVYIRTRSSALSRVLVARVLECTALALAGCLVNTATQ